MPDGRFDMAATWPPRPAWRDPGVASHDLGLDLLAARLPNRLEPGRRAPDFLLWDTSGRRRALGDMLEHHGVALCFFHGAACPRCRDLLRWVQSSAGWIRSAGGRVVAISADDPERLRQLVRAEDIRVPVLLDQGGRISDAYGLALRMLPATGARGLDRSRSSHECPPPTAAGLFVVARHGRVAWRSLKAAEFRRGEDWL